MQIGTKIVIPPLSPPTSIFPPPVRPLTPPSPLPSTVASVLCSPFFFPPISVHLVADVTSSPSTLQLRLLLFSPRTASFPVFSLFLCSSDKTTLGVFGWKIKGDRERGVLVVEVREAFAILEDFDIAVRNMVLKARRFRGRERGN
jgi:hypothetical protein